MAAQPVRRLHLTSGARVATQGKRDDAPGLAVLGQCCDRVIDPGLFPADDDGAAAARDDVVGTSRPDPVSARSLDALVGPAWDWAVPVTNRSPTRAARAINLMFRADAAGYPYADGTMPGGDVRQL